MIAYNLLYASMVFYGALKTISWFVLWFTFMGFVW